MTRTTYERNPLLNIRKDRAEVGLSVGDLEGITVHNFLPGLPQTHIARPAGPNSTTSGVTAPGRGGREPGQELR